MGDDDDVAVRRRKFHRNSRSTARLGQDVGLVLNGEATANFLSLGYGTCGQYSFWAKKGVIIIILFCEQLSLLFSNYLSLSLDYQGGNWFFS